MDLEQIKEEINYSDSYSSITRALQLVAAGVASIADVTIALDEHLKTI